MYFALAQQHGGRGVLWLIFRKAPGGKAELATSSWLPEDAVAASESPELTACCREYDPQGQFVAWITLEDDEGCPLQSKAVTIDATAPEPPPPQPPPQDAPAAAEADPPAPAGVLRHRSSHTIPDLPDSRGAGRHLSATFAEGLGERRGSAGLERERSWRRTVSLAAPSELRSATAVRLDMSAGSAHDSAGPRSPASPPPPPPPPATTGELDARSLLQMVMEIAQAAGRMGAAIEDLDRRVRDIGAAQRRPLEQELSDARRDERVALLERRVAWLEARLEHHPVLREQPPAPPSPQRHAQQLLQPPPQQWGAAGLDADGFGAALRTPPPDVRTPEQQPARGSLSPPRTPLPEAIPAAAGGPGARSQSLSDMMDAFELKLSGGSRAGRRGAYSGRYGASSDGGGRRS